MPNSPSPLSTYETRAIEVHDFVRIWDLEEMRRRLRFMVANRFNALVLHEPGIVDKIVFPAAFLQGKSQGRSLQELYEQIDDSIYYYALRENLNPFRRDYLAQLIAEAAAVGVDVYLEDKELWFKDFILKTHPEIITDGVFCPSKPFWWEEFLPAKYTELFIALPQLAGVVTSFGTGESRLAISNMHSCSCERCKHLDPAEWHRNMVLGMYGPFRDAKKKLVIRDFIYQKEEQEQFAKALARLPIEIVLSLKNTPHDFYPTFPDNPLIGQVGRREQWIEYDVYGQYFGYGLAPSIMTNDLAHRLDYGRRHNVSGYIMRTDWEGVQDYSAFDSPNRLNLYAAAAIGQDSSVDRRTIYGQWLRDEGGLAPGLSEADQQRCAQWLHDLLEPTWPLVCSIVFVNGTVFSDNSAFHVNLKQPTWIAETHHSLKNWFSGAEDALGLQDENARKILAEKDEAVAQAAALRAQAAAANPGLAAATYGDLLMRFDFMCVYAEGFRLTTRIYVFSRLLAERGNRQPSYLPAPPARLLADDIAALRSYRDRLQGSPFTRSYPANVLLGIDRLNCFLKDAEAKLKAHGA
ncbi:MAG TPA: hypothetical protein VFE31_11600 [Opitutaceae bacterium]|jgi:hypothetical protein|nr:hypothetical protein [Opitutaceae bacterium]